jgi:hypothetical protein
MNEYLATSYMYIEDLSTQPRPPGAANIWARELERDHPGLVTRSVGWLGATVASSGPVDPVALAALKHYTFWARVEDGCMGLHTCEICHNFMTNGEFWIICPGVRYVLPQMTLHYITDHGYRPPEQFLTDLREKWTAQGILKTDFPYGTKAQLKKLAPPT